MAHVLPYASLLYSHLLDIFLSGFPLASWCA